MTSSAAVRTAWEENIWESATVAALTDKCYPFEPLSDSEFLVSKLYSDADGAGMRVNFFSCVVQRESRITGIGAYTQTFQVRVAYHLQSSDQADSTFNDVVDRLEAVDDLVKSALGHTWGNTVGLYRGGAPGDLRQIDVGGKRTWRAEMVYAAEKLVSV